MKQLTDGSKVLVGEVLPPLYGGIKRAKIPPEYLESLTNKRFQEVRRRERNVTGDASPVPGPCAPQRLESTSHD